MKEITTHELTKRLGSGENIVVIDVREPVAYNDWHISGAENVPVYTALKTGDSSGLAARMQKASKNVPVVAVCNVGNTSKLAVEVLEGLGFDAFSLAGGMFGWTNSWTAADIEFDGATIVQIRRNGKGCLSYLVGAHGEGAVIDPCMDIEAYESVAAAKGLAIKHVIETHVHADHISRWKALCEKTGATLYIPKNNRVNFPYNALEDGQTVTFGGLTLTVLSTPGHTGESACYNLDNKILFSGDTIFLEALGRPDLEKGDEGAASGAGMLYDSLHRAVLPLPDSIVVCPGHTSDPIGFDGAALTATLGDIKPRVPLLKMEKAAFVSEVTGSLGLKPPNFNRVLAVNEGRAELGWLDPLELEAGPNRCAVKQP